MFSRAEDTVSNERSQIRPEKVIMLIFLNIKTVDLFSFLDGPNNRGEMLQVSILFFLPIFTFYEHYFLYLLTFEKFKDYRSLIIVIFRFSY